MYITNYQAPVYLKKLVLNMYDSFKIRNGVVMQHILRLCNSANIAFNFHHQIGINISYCYVFDLLFPLFITTTNMFYP